MLKKLLKNAHKKIKKESKDWKFERLLITAHLQHSNVCINDFMYFDGFLSHQQIRYYLGSWYYNLNQADFYVENKKEDKSDQLQVQLNLPIQKTKGGVYLASQAMYNKQNKSVNKFRKRFGEMFYMDYCRSPNGMMRTSMGKFKAIDMPVVVSNTESVSWIVIGDKKAIGKLLADVQSLGKKTNQGYGWVKKWTIEPTRLHGNRGFPCTADKTPDYYGRVRPSYHNPLNQEYIKVDNF